MLPRGEDSSVMSEWATSSSDECLEQSSSSDECLDQWREVARSCRHSSRKEHSHRLWGLHRRRQRLWAHRRVETRV